MHDYKHVFDSTGTETYFVGGVCSEKCSSLGPCTPCRCKVEHVTVRWCICGLARGLLQNRKETVRWSKVVHHGRRLGQTEKQWYPIWTGEVQISSSLAFRTVLTTAHLCTTMWSLTHVRAV